jgi:hypothetical protein
MAGMTGSARRSVVVALLAGTIGALSCADATAPDPEPDIVFEPASLELALAREAVVTLRNVGDMAVGPITIRAGQVENQAGGAVPEAAVTVSPSDIATLNPGAEQAVTLVVDSTGALPAGTYRVELAAEFPTGSARLGIEFRSEQVQVPPGWTIAIVSGAEVVRQGDVAAYAAEVRDSLGQPVDGTVLWRVVPASAGLIAQDGRLVAYEPGTARVQATIGDAADTLDIAVTPRGLSGAFVERGAGVDSLRFTSDLWVYDDVVYTGSWSARQVGGAFRYGDALTVWGLSNPTQPVVVDSVIIDARVLNDVKIRSDGGLAVLTHEASNDGANGVTILDMTDPRHPTVLSRFTSTLETGVHNVWIDGGLVYLVVDGTSPTSGLRILSVGDVGEPTVLSHFYGGASFLHDVYVRDGLAFLSHWDAGLIILDVGSGVSGGSPSNPVEVSRVITQGGETHNAWYWPSAGYVFVGEEDFATPGRLHVVDARNLSAPVEVATFDLAGAPPHNFWLDEDREILYAAWYDEGLVAIDVSGELLGDLTRQGRVYASVRYGDGVGCPSNVGAGTCTWAPQLEGGLVYVSDMNRGVVVLEPTF